MAPIYTGQNAIDRMNQIAEQDPHFHYINHQTLPRFEESDYFNSLDPATQQLFRDLGIGRNAGGSGNDSTAVVTEFMSPSNNVPFFNRDRAGRRGTSLADLFMLRPGTNAVRGRN